MVFAFELVLGLLSLLFQFPKEKIELHKISKNEVEFTTKEMLKTKSFYALWACFVIGTFVGLTMVGIASIYAQETVGLKRETATILLSVFAIFNGIGRPIFGSLVDKIGTKKTIYLSYTLIAISSLLQIIKSENTVIFIVSFILFFLNLGGWLSIVPAANINLFGREYSTQNYGFLFTAYGIGALARGLIGGYIRDTFGTYTYVFYLIVILCLVGIFITNKFIDNK